MMLKSVRLFKFRWLTDGGYRKKTISVAVDRRITVFGALLSNKQRPFDCSENLEELNLEDGNLFVMVENF